MASPIPNLTTLITRLELATSRLEHMAVSGTASNQQIHGTAFNIALGSNSLSTMTSAADSAPDSAKSLPAVVRNFDEFLESDFQKFLTLSEKIGGPVLDQAKHVQKAFAASRKLIFVAMKAKKPDPSTQAYSEMLKDLQETLSAVDAVKEANTLTPISNHLIAVADGIQMLGWIVAPGKPQDYVKQMFDSSQFYGNRVIKDYKDKDATHVQWIQSYYGVAKGLIAYITKSYPNGKVWNDKDGIDAVEAMRQVEAGVPAAPGVPSKGGPPPPPPPPPLPKFDTPPPAAPASTSDMGAVFDQISRGSNVTSGLKKVDPSQMTHKNPALRGSSSVPARSDSLTSNSSTATVSRGKSPIPSRKPESLRAKKPAKKVLESNKWYIENYDNPGEIIEIKASLMHSILITKCSKTTIRVYGKANAISIDSSSNVSLIIESLVASVDVIKTNKFEMQVLGYLPTILLDQVDTSNIYLGAESLETEILTSKCLAINVNVPGRTEEDDYKECAIPEQIKTVIRNGVAISEIVEHTG